MVCAFRGKAPYEQRLPLSYSKSPPAPELGKGYCDLKFDPPTNSYKKNNSSFSSIKACSHYPFYDAAGTMTTIDQELMSRDEQLQLLREHLATAQNRAKGPASSNIRGIPESPTKGSVTGRCDLTNDRQKSGTLSFAVWRLRPSLRLGSVGLGVLFLFPDLIVWSTSAWFKSQRGIRQASLALPLDFCYANLFLHS